MIEQLKSVLRYIAVFDEPELDKIAACFKSKSVTKNTALVKQGDICRDFYFVYKGCIRTYFLTPEGDEKTRYIMIDNYIGTALTSFITQSPSFETLDALEDSELLAIGHKDFYRLTLEIPQWQAFYQKILEMAYTFQNKKIESIVTLSAKQRYEELLNNNPLLIQRVSNKIVASYLDIRQETLSRLKSR